jgi:transposase-like protein
MNLTDPIFSGETKARAYFEGLRWPDGKPICPHCGKSEHCYRLEGKSHRPGLIHCNDCSGSFTVTTGGIMESSHIPLTKWALGFRLMASSKKGISAHQLMRSLDLGSYRTAWFMAHRIREAMKPAVDAGPLGGDFRHVEADETELGKSKKTKGTRKRRDNLKVLSLVERGGRVRSFRLDSSHLAIIKPIMEANLRKDSRLSTDMGPHWLSKTMPFPHHEMVDHSKEEWSRRTPSGDKVTTNSAEGYFSIFKRGLVGTYQHMSSQHLQRYLNEFDFRMSNRARLGVNDEMRTECAIKGASGKRLTYHQSR